MIDQTLSLTELGWRPFYSRQLTLEDLDRVFPARVASIHRSLIVVLAESGEHRLSLPPRLRADDADPGITVGDWVLVLRESLQVVRALERQSLIARSAAGTAQAVQSIAANIDTLFVVSSCNAEFNASRLERYLTLAHESQVTPVIVLTKADACSNREAFIEQAQALAGSVVVLALNATDSARSLDSLAPWLEPGQTVAFVGSSGVGKSTLINSILGTSRQDTRAVRRSDDRGRHTTTARHVLRAPGGAWLIDTPGMRELKLRSVRIGLDRTFADIDSLAAECRFRDCAHGQESGCAVRQAIADGRIESRRLENYLKLAREAQRAAIPPWKRRELSRQGGRMARAAQARRRRDRGGT